MMGVAFMMINIMMTIRIMIIMMMISLMMAIMVMTIMMTTKRKRASNYNALYIYVISYGFISADNKYFCHK